MRRFQRSPYLISRILLAAPFVAGGLGYFRDRKAQEELVRKLGYPAPQAAAFIDAAAKVGGGLSLAAGVRPQLSAATLIANLAPMTLSLHAFWTEREVTKRTTERNAFIINLALAGGLLAVSSARSTTLNASPNRKSDLRRTSS